MFPNKMENPQDTHESKHYINQTQVTKQNKKSPANHAKEKWEINPKEWNPT